MRHAILVLLAFALLIAGCVQSPGENVVNVTQNNTPPSVNITSNQTGGLNMSENVSAIPSQEISYLTSDSWKIYGTFYPSKNAFPKEGIILLHELGADRSGFNPLIPVLHEALPDADILAIDLRGHGKSTNLGTYTNFITGDYRAMTNDVKGAVNYLAFFRHYNDNFYLVGSSIGSSVAINYADQDAAIQKIVMLSPGLNYENVDVSSALGHVKKEVFFVASSEDEQSATDAQAMYALSNAYTKRIYVYKSIDASHGTDMLIASTGSKTEQPLSLIIANWLQ